MKSIRIIAAIAALCSLNHLSAMYQEAQQRKMEQLQAQNKQNEITQLTTERANILEQGKQCFDRMKSLNQQMATAKSTGNMEEINRIQQELDYYKQQQLSLISRKNALEKQLAELK